MSIRPFDIPDSNIERLAAREGMNDWCGVKECNRPQYKGMPLCEEHAQDICNEMMFHHMDINAAYEAHMRSEDTEAIRKEVIRERLGVEEFLATYKQAPGIIYYLKVEDQVKIGFTTDLETRIKAYPPMAKLLATHPGTRETERQMHDKFAEHLSGRKEWFREHLELETHIDGVRRQFKQDSRVTA